MYAVFKGTYLYCFFTEFLSVIRNLKPYLKPLITGKTSYHNSTSLLIRLHQLPVSQSFLTVLFPTELTYRVFCFMECFLTCFFFDPAPAYSHIVSMQYHRRLGLKIVFGMGTGVSLSASTPEVFSYPRGISELSNKLVLITQQ